MRPTDRAHVDAELAELKGTEFTTEDVYRRLNRRHYSQVPIPRQIGQYLKMRDDVIRLRKEYCSSKNCSMTIWYAKE